MYILFPGRHLVMTNYQFHYLYTTIHSLPGSFRDINGQTITIQEPIEGVIFAVTSANHSNTRRNPVPFYQRVIGLTEFMRELPVPGYIFGIDDVGDLANFAPYVLKRILHLSEGRFHLTPANTLVLCSTPVYELYEKENFKILPCEKRENGEYAAPLPWSIIEKIAAHMDDWRQNHFVLENMHPASYNVWSEYLIGEKTSLLFRDTIIGNDGDITETRDYTSYVRQMDEIAEIKYLETAPFIRPGRIGDIGCAVGSWIKYVSSSAQFRESDFYGIEVVRKLFELCEQRKSNGDFGNPFIFFSQKNAVSETVFEKNSMNTIHSSSLTHEIYSYGGREDLLAFIRNRFQELVSGGVWINRDVVGPENGEMEVYMALNTEDGSDLPANIENIPEEQFAAMIAACSTYSRFIQFARDFRKTEGDQISWSSERIGSREYIRIALRDACEFLYKKDYTDNWHSEMHEFFCFWSFGEWSLRLEGAGFRIHQQSHTFKNEWIVSNRLQGKAELFVLHEGRLTPYEYPDTHMLLIAEKI